ncbi:hypothetical protein ZWY2020_034668 [Hordeum vulgare]|nr:hypothetical protein ZWY2020_034668 [Hordeum vulgare]
MDGLQRRPAAAAAASARGEGQPPGGQRAIHCDVEPAPRAWPGMQMLALAAVLVLGGLQLLPATHTRHPADRSRTWVPVDPSRHSQDLSHEVASVDVFSSISCLIFVLLLDPHHVSFNFVIPEGGNDQVPYYKIKAVLPDSNITVTSQKQIKDKLNVATPEGNFLRHSPMNCHQLLLQGLSHERDMFISQQTNHKGGGDAVAVVTALGPARDERCAHRSRLGDQPQLCDTLQPRSRDVVKSLKKRIAPRTQRSKYTYEMVKIVKKRRAGGHISSRSNGSVPIFTPPQTQPLQNYPPALRNADHEAPESSAQDFPATSLADIQNARNIMDVLSEMLNAVDPSRCHRSANLVDQCRTYKRECCSLSTAPRLRQLLQVQASSHPLNNWRFAPPAPRSSSSAKAVVPAPAPSFDLLSGDDFIKPEPENSLALVPVSEYSASDQNVLALADMFQQIVLLPAMKLQPAYKLFYFPCISSIPTLRCSLLCLSNPTYSNGDIVPYGQQSQLNATRSWNGQIAYGVDSQASTKLWRRGSEPRPSTSTLGNSAHDGFLKSDAFLGFALTISSKRQMNHEEDDAVSIAASDLSTLSSRVPGASLRSLTVYAPTYPLRTLPKPSSKRATKQTKAPPDAAVVRPLAKLFRSFLCRGSRHAGLRFICVASTCWPDIPSWEGVRALFRGLVAQLRIAARNCNDWISGGAPAA